MSNRLFNVLMAHLKHLNPFKTQIPVYISIKYRSTFLLSVPFYYLYFVIVLVVLLYLFIICTFLLSVFYYCTCCIIVLTYFILIYTVMLRLVNIGAGYFALKSILAKIAFSFFFWTLSFSNFLGHIVFG